MPNKSLYFFIASLISCPIRASNINGIRAKDYFLECRSYWFYPPGLPIFVPKSQAPPKPKSPKSKRSTTTSQSQDTRRRRSSALDTKTAQASESSVRRVVNLHWLTLSPPTRGQALNSLQHQYDPGPGPLDWHSDHFLVVRSVLQPGQEDYFKEIAEYYATILMKSHHRPQPHGRNALGLQ